MILYPNAHFNNVREITINFLQNNKINALILDVDNTLIDYDKNLSVGRVGLEISLKPFKKLDDEYIEKVAREKLGMIKRDEIVFVDISG